MFAMCAHLLFSEQIAAWLGQLFCFLVVIFGEKDHFEKFVYIEHLQFLAKKIISKNLFTLNICLCRQSLPITNILYRTNFLRFLCFAKDYLQLVSDFMVGFVICKKYTHFL
eukprot:TRINITY_DN6600_c0_g1_i7.p5 TRINITY_DN6600_c0_g1~~TRINITY_DN6600_c0_g1_i7.p5  ORF type:complete len:111 (-),score=2.19 TRINITY_DN6600_c0_g1_i7:93-425(-)